MNIHYTALDTMLEGGEIIYRCENNKKRNCIIECINQDGTLNLTDVNNGDEFQEVDITEIKGFI